MASPAAPASGVVVLLLLLLALSVLQNRSDARLTYISARICAVSGSTVDIRCSYRPPSSTRRRSVPAEQTLWFSDLQQDGAPADLRTEPEYDGRVKYFCDRTTCTLRISELRRSDSAEYKFKFKHKPNRKFIKSPGVSLSVSDPDLQVQVSRSFSRWADLLCSSSCVLPRWPSYVWFKNGQKLQDQTSASYADYFDPADSVSCALRGREDFPSPPACVFGESCNRVIYTDRRICASKGSSVEISCSYNSYYDVKSKFWFSPERSHRWQKPSEPEDLSKDSEYSGRVQVVEPERGRSTLRITDLRDTDSAQYHFKFKAGNSEWRSILPGTTLTVTDVQLQVFRVIGVHRSHTEAELRCVSSCGPTGIFVFVWFKNGREVQDESSSSYTDDFDVGDDISCALRGFEDHRSASVYAPKLPSVSVSPSAEIVEGSSVTLTCSSDANPAAKLTWYKEKDNKLSERPQFVFSSIQSSESGEYYCVAENEMGTRTSEYIFIDVKYAPKLPSVSVSPSAEIVEGSSVTLTCSSDANPAAKLTWYKENQVLLQGAEEVHHFSSISSEDRGTYHCKSENQFGWMDSFPLFIDVLYAPKLPSVSVSPSAEIMEGSSVTLTCSSDANPAANYTWYKEDEDSPKASGQIFTITDLRPEHSGNYSCEAQNTIGRQKSTLNLTVVVPGSSRSRHGITVCLLLSGVMVFLWKRWLSRRRQDGTSQSQTPSVLTCPPLASKVFPVLVRHLFRLLNRRRGNSP